MANAIIERQIRLALNRDANRAKREAAKLRAEEREEQKQLFIVNDGTEELSIKSTSLIEAGLDFVLMRGDKYGKENGSLVVTPEKEPETLLLTSTSEIIQQEIAEMFDEFNNQIDVRSFYRQYSTDSEENDSVNMNATMAWKLGIKKEKIQDLPWRMFRMRAATPERMRKWLLAIGLILTGEHSMRSVHRISGYHKNTSRRLFYGVNSVVVAAGGSIKCPCGQEIVYHTAGFCAFRLSRSEKRRAFMDKFKKVNNLRYSERTGKELVSSVTESIKPTLLSRHIAQW